MLSSESLRTYNGIVYTNTGGIPQKKKPFISHVIHVSLELIGSVKVVLLQQRYHYLSI